MNHVKQRVTTHYSAKQMYQLVNDIERYPEFLPWCGGVRILERDNDSLTACLDFAVAGFHKSFTTRNRMQQDKMIEIRLVDGPFTHLEGFWIFEDLENNRSEIRFEMHFELAGGLFNFAFEPMFHQIASTMVESFCERAKNIY